MSIIDSLSVSVSGMTAQRQRVNTISENLANAKQRGLRRAVPTVGVK